LTAPVQRPGPALLTVEEVRVWLALVPEARPVAV
jgi:hypothetical protein